MILSGNKILECIHKDEIEISPFSKDQIDVNSYNVTLGKKLLVYKEDFVDTSKKNDVLEITIPDDGILLQKNRFYVGHIGERIGSNYFVPMLHGIKSIAKKGLFIHITANLIDIGNCCNFSLQLFPTENIFVYPGMIIAQVSFWKTKGNITLYEGKYKGVIGPASSQSYKHKGL